VWGLKLVQILGPSLRKRIQNYAYTTRYRSEYLFWMRKEIATNYQFKKADKHYGYHNIQKYNLIFFY
jgi:hypothetical protein